MNETTVKLDSIIVAASIQNFESEVVGQSKWGPIRVNAIRIPNLKYVFFYIRKPISAVTHYALIEEFLFDRNLKKYNLKIGSLKKLDIEIPFGVDQRSAPQSPRLSNFKTLIGVKTLSDIYKTDNSSRP